MGEITKSDFLYTFIGEKANSLDIETVTETLNQLNVLVLESIKALYPESKSSLQITATQQGSFEVHLRFFAITAISLFTPENVEYAANIITIIQAFFAMKKHIGNNKPANIQEEKNSIIITNADDKPETFPKEAGLLLENPVFENCVVNMINSANGQEGVEGIGLGICGERMEIIEKEQFNNMNESVIKLPNKKTETLNSTDTLFIKSPMLSGDAKWTFKKDKDMLVKISDKDWLSRFQRGDFPFVPGVRMVAKMETTVEIGENGMPIDNSAQYEIVEVIDIVYPKTYKQEELF